MTRIKTIALCAGIALAGIAGTNAADAKGCIKGAIVGGVAGHYAGHHGVLGAAAGCLYEHHREKKQARQQQREQRQRQQRQTTGSSNGR